MLVLGVEHWRIEENLACLLCYSKLGLNESTRCYGKLSAAVFSDEFGAKFAGECQLKINLYSVWTSGDGCGRTEYARKQKWWRKT